MPALWDIDIFVKHEIQFFSRVVALAVGVLGSRLTVLTRFFLNLRNKTKD